MIVAWICLSCGTIAVFSWLWRRRELTGIAAISPDGPRLRSRAGLKSRSDKEKQIEQPEPEKEGKGEGKVVDETVAYEK